MAHIFIGIAILVAGGGLIFLNFSGVMDTPIFFGFLVASVGYIWVLVGFLHYRVQSFAYLAAHKRLGDEIGFEAGPRTGKIVGIFIIGSILISVVMSIAFAVLGVFTAGALSFSAGELSLGGLPSELSYSLLIPVVGYFVAIVLANAMGLSLITQPIFDHIINSMTITNVSALSKIQQREHDTGADAEGFADALDVGGAI